MRSRVLASARLAAVRRNAIGLGDIPSKTAARGFRNIENFIAMTYLRMPKLKHLPQPSCASRCPTLRVLPSYLSRSQFPQKTV